MKIYHVCLAAWFASIITAAVIPGDQWGLVVVAGIAAFSFGFTLSKDK